MAGARRFVIVHAAAVALDGKAVLLCGDSGTGKTSVAWACARRGWTFLSGDAIQLVRQSADLEVVGRPHSIRFRDSARELFPELRGYNPAPGPRGKLDIEADPVSLGAAIAQSATASHIVLLERCPGGTGSLEPISADRMFAYFDQVICYGAESLRGEQRDALRQFLQLPLLHLRYPDPETAERILRQEVSCSGS